MKRFEEFLEEGGPRLGWAEYARHPSQRLLAAYVYNQLGREMASRVSAHVATCRSCYNEVQRLREELEALESSLTLYLPDPLKIQPERERLPLLEQVKRFFKSWELFPAQRRVFYVHAGAYAVAAALLFGINVLLDRLLIPPPSPFASPVKITRWWTHLYWLLLPWGLLLLAHGIRTFLLKSKRGGTRNHAKGRR